MSQYLVLSRIEIQNANSIAGLTWGFPAITNFLGFIHALNRKASSVYQGKYATELSGCAVISHTIQNKVYQPKKFAAFEFIQSKNPPVLAKHKSASPPIIEEGKMNLCVSLVVELSQALTLTTDGVLNFQKHVQGLCYQMRIAGGTVLNINKTKLLSGSTEKQEALMLRQIKRLTMPGFVLLDRSPYLKEHHQNLSAQHEKEYGGSKKPELIDAWLDFSALKYKAQPQLAKEQTQPDEKTAATWEYIPKPKLGYLVPLMTGYKAISDVYEAGKVANTRDEITSTCFVEAVHSVGEWKGMHSTQSIKRIIWRYKQDGSWYLCEQKSQSNEENNNTQNFDTTDQNTQTLNINEVLNIF